MKLTEFLQLFKQGKVSAYSHIKNLYEMALADGQYVDSEDELLHSIARKHNVSKKIIDQIREDKDTIEFVLPDSEDEKFNQFYDLVNMMVVDKNIAEEEMKLCVIFARKFGYHPEFCEELARSVAGNISMGHSIDETKARVMRLIA